MDREPHRRFALWPGRAGRLRGLALAAILVPALAAAADRVGGEFYAENIDWIGYHDLDGKPALQMALQVVDGRYYLYLAGFYHPGVHILDVTDPADPAGHMWVPDAGGKKGTMALKVQVADGIMITPVSQALPIYHGNSPEDPYDAGINIWDVRDPLNPKLLSHWAVDGFGAHRSFFNGGRYVHVSASASGFSGMIYRIVDIADPTKPVEAGRFWLPEQWTAGGGQPEPSVDGTSLHGPPYVKGNLAYLPYSGAGTVIVDISDVAAPKLVGRLDAHPPFGDQAPPTHTVLPLSQRPLAIVTSEGRRPPTLSRESITRVPPANFMGMVDVSDPSNPTLIALFPTPVPPPKAPYPNFSEVEGLGAFGFGPHNLHQPEGLPALEDRNDRIYCTYFNAGLRIYNISDPYLPREIAYFIPPVPEKLLFERLPGPRVAVTEDVLVDDRGNIFMTTNQQGLFVLRSRD
jgi:hypothetical protein